MIAERAMASVGDTSVRDQSRLDRRTLIRSLIVADAAVIVIAVILTDLVRIFLESYLHIWPLAAERHAIASIMVPPVLLGVFALGGLYDLDLILAGTREYARVLQSVTYGVLIALGVSYFAGGNPLVSRLWLILIFSLTIVAVWVERFVMRRVVRRERRRGRLRTRVIVVGASSHGVAIAAQLSEARSEGLDIVGFLDEYVTIGQRLLGEIAVIGRPADLLRADAAARADEYILVPQALPSERLEQISATAASRTAPIVRMAVSTTDLLTNGVLIAERASVPMLRVRPARIVGVDAAMKRGLDLAGATLGLLLLGPVALVALVWGYARGVRPLLRRYELRGGRGESVTTWLLDPAVSASLLVRGAPALLAVLRGGLSLVGHEPVRLDHGGSGIPPTRLALARPGLTGPWRVSDAAATSEELEARDLMYVRNYNIWEDLRIISASLRGLKRRESSTRLRRWQVDEAVVPTYLALESALGEPSIGSSEPDWELRR